MTYFCGIDLGTTFTAAAVWRNGRAEIATLGSRTAAIPSVVLLREDETVLTGEAANRRALSEPDRVAREFKRRLGDSTPLLLGGVPYSAEALMARLLRWVIGEVSTREGAAPGAIAISHPANWGEYKIDLLRQAVRLADLGEVAPVELITEPEAAAIHYASHERVETGQVVAVYDLGGGTFDAAVLRKTPDGFEILGEPEGIERLGGIDFDAAVFAHVARSLGDDLADLDEDDPATVAAVGRLKAECVEAKEALSSDTDASIPVLLPTVQTEVRITRVEFESMIRPALVDSIDALRRALRSAGVEATDVHKVLLVGGSSRIPLVAQLVGSEIGRPVAVDAHPKHAVALGAARAAVHDTVDGEADVPPGAAVAAAAVAGVAVDSVPPDPGVDPAPPSPPPPGEVGTPAGPVPSPGGSAAPPPGPFVPSGSGSDGPNRRPWALVAIAVVAVAVIVGAIVLFGGGDDDGDTVATEATGQTDASDTTTAPTSPATSANAASSATTTPPTSTTGAPTTTTTAVEACAELRSLDRWACITGVELRDDRFVATYEAELAAGEEANVSGGFHFHFFGSIPVSEAGVPGDGPWEVWDRPDEFAVFLNHPVLAGSDQLCVLVAQFNHTVIPDTGNCVDLPAEITTAVAAAG